MALNLKYLQENRAQCCMISKKYCYLAKPSGVIDIFIHRFALDYKLAACSINSHASICVPILFTIEST